MKIQRTKNAARNVLTGTVLRAIVTVMPFFMRMVMLRFLGVEYLGLNGLFRSILSFLNLAELGVGSAMVFSMYKPIAEDDTETICALMKLYRFFYRIIGLVIAGVGLALTPFLRNLISGDLPSDVNLYILYYMNLASTVLTYWLFAYKNSLVYAHQRNDVISSLKIILYVIEYGLKILVLAVFHNYYLYLIIQLVNQVAINLFSARRVSRMYPDYVPRGSLPKEQVREIGRRVRDLFTAKFSTVISGSADTLVISAFLGLAPLAVFQNYLYIITAVTGMLDVVIGACIAGIGNSLITESVEKNYKDLHKLSMLFSWLLSISSAMLLCMFQPFMELWMGKENMLAFSYVVCFTVYFYFTGMNKLFNMFKDAAGIWHRDRFRPLTAALVNLALNLATVRWLGLYGVLLSTVVSILFVEFPWLLHNLFTEIFPRDYLWAYLRSFLGFVAVTGLCCVAPWFICSRFALAALPAVFVNACLSFLLPNVIFILFFGRDGAFRACVDQIKGVIARKR